MRTYNKAETKTKFEKQDSEETQKRAFSLSLKYLSFRPHSVKEINDYLLKKGFMEKTVSKTLKRLLVLKFLNDEEFGRQWIESRQKHKGKSKFVLKNELKAKGLDKELTEKLLQTAIGDLKTAKDFFERKKNKLKYLPKEEFNKKIVGMLQRKGYNWNIISKVLDKGSL